MDAEITKVAEHIALDFLDTPHEIAKTLLERGVQAWVMEDIEH